MEKVKFFLTMVCQLINVEETVKLENHHLATIRMIDSRQNSETNVKDISKFFMRIRMFI